MDQYTTDVLAAFGLELNKCHPPNGMLRAAASLCARTGASRYLSDAFPSQVYEDAKKNAPIYEAQLVACTDDIASDSVFGKEPCAGLEQARIDLSRQGRCCPRQSGLRSGDRPRSQPCDCVLRPRRCAFSRHRAKGRQLWRFRETWTPVLVKTTHQNKSGAWALIRSAPKL